MAELERHLYTTAKQIEARETGGMEKHIEVGPLVPPRNRMPTTQECGWAAARRSCIPDRPAIFFSHWIGLSKRHRDTPLRPGVPLG